MFPIFPSAKGRPAVVGMLHAPPLPGSPRCTLSMQAVVEFVLRDASALAEGGVDGLLLENFGDAPFYADHVPPATVAQITRLAAEVRRRCALPLGINVLRNDACAALAIAASVGAEFIRVNILAGARLTDQGIIAGGACALLRLRRELRAESVQIFADVDVKHSAPLAPRPLADEAADLVHRAGADGLIVSGSATGAPASPEDLRQVKAAAGPVQVFVGSGVTADNVAEFAGADGFIVGSWLKAGGQLAQPVDPQRVRQLMARLA